MKIIYRDNNTFVRLSNGTVEPVRPGYTSMTTDGPGIGEHYPDGSELWFTGWDGGSVGGYNVSDLADGGSWQDLGISRKGDVYTSTNDGSVWTRHGDELVVWTPGRLAEAA